MAEPNLQPSDENVDANVNREINKGYQLAKETSHADFVTSVEAKKMYYELHIKHPSNIIRQREMFVFGIYIAMYLVVPVVSISILAYEKTNWLLLTGIIISALGCLFALKRPKYGLTRVCIVGLLTMNYCSLGKNFKKLKCFHSYEGITTSPKYSANSSNLPVWL